MLKIRKKNDYELKLIRSKGDGKVQGLFQLDDPTYRSQPGLSASQLKEFRISPASYINSLTSPNKQTPAMFFGTSAHTKILEPEEFTNRYALEPVFDGPKIQKPWKGEWEAFKEANASKDILTRDQWATLEAMQISLFGMHHTAKYLEEGYPEVSMFWIDPATGVQCKAKMDWISERYGIADYKTTSNRDFGGTEEEVEKALSTEVARYKYWLQQAHYVSGMIALDLPCPHEFVFLFNKTHSGFEAAPYVSCPEDAAQAYKVRNYLMRQFRECQARDSWPGLTYELIMGRMPRWAFA